VKQILGESGTRCSNGFRIVEKLDCSSCHLAAVCLDITEQVAEMG
jgi:hypothetical protein